MNRSEKGFLGMLAAVGLMRLVSEPEKNVIKPPSPPIGPPVEDIHDVEPKTTVSELADLVLAGNIPPKELIVNEVGEDAVVPIYI